MKMKIAFGCKAGSGKSTAVHYLINKYGGVEKSFASPLYDILYYAQKTCNFPIEKDRKFLQYIGTEWARAKDDNVWVNILLRTISDENGNIFISDVRFKNEFDSLKDAGFIMILIERETRISLSHISENSLNEETGWDYIIKNNSSLENLYECLDKIIFKISEKESI